MTVSFIIPTYNEKDNIIELIDQIIRTIKKTKFDYEVVVVDDDSPDKTGVICRNHFFDTNRIATYIRKKDKGFASAIYYGIKKSKGKIIIVMDADFSHDPNIIPKMLSKIKTYDIIIGSRYVRDGGGENRKRFLLSKMYNIYLRYLLGINISDFLFGFFCIKKEYMVKNNLLNREIFTGFGDYFIRLSYYINLHRGRFLEIPAFYKNRMHGVSKSNIFKMLITYTISSFQVLLLKFKNN